MARAAVAPGCLRRDKAASELLCSTSRLESAAARATLYPFLPVYGTFLQRYMATSVWVFNMCTASGDQNNLCRTEESNTRQYRAWLFGPVHPSLQKHSKQKEKEKKKKWFKLDKMILLWQSQWRHCCWLVNCGESLDGAHIPRVFRRVRWAVWVLGEPWRTASLDGVHRPRVPSKASRVGHKPGAISLPALTARPHRRAG